MEYESLKGEKQKPAIIHIDNLRHTKFTANWHEELEILYVISGEGAVICNYTKYPVKAGDIFIVNSNMIHATMSQSEMNICCLIINKSLVESLGVNITNCCFKNKIQDPRIESYIMHAYDEYSKKETLSNACLQAYISLIVVQLLRYHAEESFLIGNSMNYLRITEAIDYIKDNFASPITGEELAKRIGLSKSYFLREFKTYTGFTVTHFINKLRCDNAKNLLGDPALSVSTISERCGYKNYCYFSRIFKEYCGISPQEFRNYYYNQKVKHKKYTSE